MHYRNIHELNIPKLVSPERPFSEGQLEESIRDEKKRTKINYSEVYNDEQINKIQRYQSTLIDEIKNQNQMRINKGFLFIYNKIGKKNSKNQASNLLMKT